MSKIIRITETFLKESEGLGPFSLHDYWESFLSSPLGQVYQSIPWSELVSVFGLSDHSKGPLSIFPPFGQNRSDVFEEL